jgi:hypothetical protein
MEGRSRCDCTATEAIAPEIGGKPNIPKINLAFYLL